MKRRCTVNCLKLRNIIKWTSSLILPELCKPNNVWPSCPPFHFFSFFFFTEFSRHASQMALWLIHFTVDQVRAQPRHLPSIPFLSVRGDFKKSTRCCGRTVERLMPLKAIPTQKANLWLRFHECKFYLMVWTPGLVYIWHRTNYHFRDFFIFYFFCFVLFFSEAKGI